MMYPKTIDQLVRLLGEEIKKIGEGSRVTLHLSEGEGIFNEAFNEEVVKDIEKQFRESDWVVETEGRNPITNNVDVILKKGDHLIYLSYKADKENELKNLIKRKEELEDQIQRLEAEILEEEQRKKEVIAIDDLPKSY